VHIDSAAADSGAARPRNVSPTNVIVLRDRVIYFEASAEEFRTSPDAYLQQFLASAG
jgi:ABC-type transporter Mla maintaining outer membrane lipid asymmetry ATPase subunit MlaF